MFRRSVTFLLVVTAVGCGGTTELQEGDGSGGTGGSGASGGTSSNTSTTSGSISAVATNGVANTTGGLDCSGFECGGLPCPDGELIVPPGECCPVCVCTGGECEPLDCPSERVVTPAGACCSECAHLQCEGVVCDGPTECGAGSSFSRPAGACCAACLQPPDAVACSLIGCPEQPQYCPPGYVAGDLAGGCCYECLPDPLYCVADTDCALANRPRTCCGCEEVISTRALDDDPCWVPVGEPWDIPEECYPDFTCDAVCGACPDPGGVVCENNRCTQILRTL